MEDEIVMVIISYSNKHNHEINTGMLEDMVGLNIINYPVNQLLDACTLIGQLCNTVPDLNNFCEQLDMYYNSI